MKHLTVHFQAMKSSPYLMEKLAKFVFQNKTNKQTKRKKKVNIGANFHQAT